MRSSGEGFVTRNFFLIAVSATYLTAALGPLWGLGWGSPAVVWWSAFLVSLLAAGTWRLVRPSRLYPSTDFGFIIPLVLAVNFFSSLLGPDRGWLQPMNFLIVALCALYYSLGFNLAVAGLIFVLEGLHLAFSPGRAGLRAIIDLSVFGAYLGGAALILGRLLQSEHKKKERAVKAVKRLQEGALSLGEHAEEASIKSISPEGRLGTLVDSAALLDKALMDLLDTVRTAMPSGNALLFMSDKDGDGVNLRVFIGEGIALEDCKIASGQGLVGWVAKEKKPLLANDRAKGLGYLKNEEAVRSFIAAPILNKGSLEGVIALDSSLDEAFTEADRETLMRFAGMAVYLIQNAREYQQVDLTAKNFAALHKISSEMSSSLEIDDILEKLASLSRDIVPYDYLTISLLEGEGSARFKTVKGYDGATPPEGPVPITGTLLGWITENRQQLSFSDADRRADRLPIFPVKELQAGFRSFLGIPLLSQDKVLGVFTLALRQPDAISGYQQHMLSITANQAAVNIANAGLHQTIRQMATTDGLTGLINHRHFQEKTDAEFQRAARYPQPLSILLLDIDHFKKVNDTYGHPVGDAVLRKVARILGDAVRSVDVAGRYGGEEFVALLVNTDEKGAHKMAERIRTAIEKSRFTLDGRNIPVTVSIGCASFPSDAAEKKDLIEKADQALYWAKSHGRNQCSAYSRVRGALAAKND